MRNDIESLYELLGVEPGASEDEIRSAFRDRAKSLHPDQNEEDYADTVFKRVKKARDVGLKIEGEGMDPVQAKAEVFGHANNFQGSPGEGVHQTGHTDEPEETAKTEPSSGTDFSSADSPSETVSNSSDEPSQDDSKEEESEGVPGVVGIFSMIVLVITVPVIAWIATSVGSFSFKTQVGVTAGIPLLVFVPYLTSKIRSHPAPEVEKDNFHMWEFGLFAYLALHGLLAFAAYKVIQYSTETMFGTAIAAGILLTILLAVVYYGWFSFGSLVFLGLSVYVLYGFTPHTDNGMSINLFDLVLNLGFPLLALADIFLLLMVFYDSPLEVERKAKGYANEWVWPSIPLVATVGILTAAWFEGHKMIALSYYYVPFILAGLAILRSWVVPKLKSSDSQTSSEKTDPSST